MAGIKIILSCVACLLKCLHGGGPAGETVRHVPAVLEDPLDRLDSITVRTGNLAVLDKSNATEVWHPTVKMHNTGDLLKEQIGPTNEIRFP
jgi:hypothetical protein